MHLPNALVTSVDSIDWEKKISTIGFRCYLMTLLAIRLVELRHVKFRDTFQGIYLENQTVVGSDIHITAK